MQDSVLTRLLRHAERAPDHAAWTQVAQDGTRRTWTRGGLLARAAGVAAALAEQGVQRGDTVALIISHGDALAVAWLGAVLHGAVPTLLAEPSVRMPAEIYTSMIGHLLGYLQPRAVLVSGERTAQLLARAAPDVTLVDVDGLQACNLGQVRLPTGTDVLAIQHSSGTTGRHKGVLLTHQQVLAQIDAYAAALRLDPATDRIASWLPLYHDMGFIACFVMPLVTGIETVQMSPFVWVSRPWLLPQVVSATRSTLSWLPNFAYHLLATRCTDAHLQGVDLASWRQVIDCSEPCTATAIDRFLARFQPFGLRPESVGVSYAMAETVFAVTEAGVRRPVVRRAVSRAALQVEHRLADDTSADAIAMIGCGTPIADCEVQVRSSDGVALPTDAIGELWVRAPFLMRGYHGRPDLDAQVLRDGWYGTGDLGCMAADGEVFVTGRAKDLLIIGGINVQPQDIEEIVSEVAGVVPGRSVAVGDWNAQLDTQRLVALVESDLTERADRDRVNLAIRSAVGSRTEVQVADVRVYPRGTLRKSTSGKLSRSANLALYQSGATEDALWAAALALQETT